MRKASFYVIAFLFFSTSAFCQGVISGKITNSATNAPIEGVSVMIKGGSSAVSSSSGTFSLKTLKNEEALIISSVGFFEKTVRAKAGETVTITLAEDVRSLAEVVVTGVGVATSKRKLGIAVESITSDKLPKTINASVDQALVGKIAGAQISSTNGSPGAPTNILLRGINTLNRGTSPMILLDGLEVRATDLNSLDLNSIERIEVVQGAASATLYGAQGANGVIQLFSKKGKQGRVNIDFSSSISTNSLLNVGKVHKSAFHSFTTNANNEVIGSSGNPLVFDPALSLYEENVGVNLIDPKAMQNKPYDKNLLYYDHYKMFFQASNTTNNSISISGGREKFDFNISASDNRQNTNFKGNGDFARSNFTSNIGLEVAKNLRFRSITQLVYTKNTQLDTTGRTILYALNNSRPFANYDYKSADGNYGAYFGDAVGVNGFNPNYQNQYGSVNRNKIDIVQNFNLNYRLSRFLELDAKYGLNYQTQDNKNSISDQTNNLNADNQQNWLEGYAPFISYGSPGTASTTGEINIDRIRTTFQNFISTATIRTDLSEDFNINLPIKTATQLSFDYR